MATEPLDTALGDGIRMVYVPLSPGSLEFRTLTLHPGKQGDQLRGDLDVVELRADDIPVYETCSYAWGDANLRSRMIVNGTTIDVPTSTCTMLRRVRLEDAPRIVWIDSICINQGDIDERSRQVQMMGDIFRNGTRNLVYWCGEDDYLQDALAGIKAIQDNYQNPDFRTKLFDQEGFRIEITEKPLKCAYSVEALGKFLQPSWMRRVWTFQEACLARNNTCLCGTSELALLDITRSAAWFYVDCKFSCRSSPSRKAAFMPSDLNNFLDPDSWYARGRYSRRMDVISKHLRRRECSVPADKIYGSLSLIGASALTPDYTKSTARIYTEFVEYLIQTRIDLRWLSVVENSQHRTTPSTEGLPSWVPDFNVYVEPAKRSTRFSLDFDADDKVAHQARVAPKHADTSLLQVAGFAVGTIDETTPRFRSCSFQDIIDWILPMTSRAMCKPQDSPIVELAAAMTTSDGTRHLVQDLHGDDIIKGYRASRYYWETGSKVPDLGELDEYSTEPEMLASKYEERFRKTCKRRRFFATSEGTIGVGPTDMKKDDIAAVWYGCPWPVILRPADGMYAFIGVAYVYGIMFGEAVRKHKQDGAEDVTFCVR